MPGLRPPALPRLRLRRLSPSAHETAMGQTHGATAVPTEVERPETSEATAPELPWLVIVWNDPINLMTYVTYVFQKLFGYSRAKAHKLMLDVHYKGRAVVSSGPKERAELDVARLHQHGLWATMEHSG
jgi:ATP-dependent Clp protease adaptor protein ClpS